MDNKVECVSCGAKVHHVTITEGWCDGCVEDYNGTTDLADDRGSECDITGMDEWRESWRNAY